jgi:hypothetical protein
MSETISNENETYCPTSSIRSVQEYKRNRFLLAIDRMTPTVNIFNRKTKRLTSCINTLIGEDMMPR